SLWQSRGAAAQVSEDLATVLRATDHWRCVTGDALHPGVEHLTQCWQAAERDQRLPEAAELQRLAGSLRAPTWTWSEDGRVCPGSHSAISLNALAKGYIIDHACAAGGSVRGVTGLVVNIGGDLKVDGELAPLVEIPAVVKAGQVADRVNLRRIQVRSRSLATSSGAYRGFSIGGRQWSHLLDPRTGWPVERVVSASVLAPRAVDADALATACSVLGPDESIELINSLPDTDCLLQLQDGSVVASEDWPNSEAADGAAFVWADSPAPSSTPDWNGGFELTLDLEINQAVGGARYRRPYVAAWVEDQDGYPVKTLALWVQSTGPGPRWIPDLKRWYRGDLMRKLVEEADLVATVSEATRRPGKYQLRWNGLDNEGALVKPGDYTLCLEAAREHGTYQLMRRKLTFGKTPFRHTLEGNVEIKAATVDYHRIESPATSAN
ncbi:MAG: DUF2271 domain-containing protein, partial [Planctomycetaceae bacterium]|nr:DUF2271 domain-containing protein [Planctomycetaceae bacterium]